MRKIILGTLAFLAVQSAQAFQVQCNFTEPFITVAFNSEKSQLTHYVYGDKAQDVRATSERQGNVLKVKSVDQKIKLDIYLDVKGNDGMSDREYAFEGILNGNLYGGCDEIK